MERGKMGVQKRAFRIWRVVFAVRPAMRSRSANTSTRPV
jgi:hypothetical protein